MVKYIYFRSRGFLSPWYLANFKIDGDSYSSVEQYMMAQKAKFFGDIKALNEILAINDPSSIKKIGRKIAPFNSSK